MDIDKSKKIDAIKIQSNASILNALQLMDKTFHRLLLVMKNERFINILSIGDIQRAIIKNIDLNTEIENILRPNTLISNTFESIDLVKSKMLENRIECMPVVNDSGSLVDVLFWNDVFGDSSAPSKKQLNLPVVIMAGGEGTRLRPITYVLPKALIPFGKQSMLEKIIDSFLDYGCNDFYISVNYKAEMIEHYIADVQKNRFKVDFIKENQPLGTAGSLSGLKNKISKTLIVINCDILIQDDYSAILDYHVSNKNDLTIVSALKHISIPYGIIETRPDGLLDSMTEKPDFTFQINSGMYILEPRVLNEIPDNTFFHMTHLIEKLAAQNKKVGVFPVSQKSWIDIGNWSEYLQSNIE